jgi:FdrA protein
MFTRTVVKPNRFYDSLLLMRVSQDLLKRPGVMQAALLMGTDANKQSLIEMAPASGLEGAGPNDLILLVGADTDAQARAAEEFALEALTAERARTTPQPGLAAPSLARALRRQPRSNLVLLSIPGAYVKHEARKALDAGLHVMIFSDNVPLKDEVELKQTAHARGLLLMGPDCGTAILGGVGLGFANAVRRGRIGLVGASGTGLQEVTCLIDRLGQGTSHAIGTGSRDIQAEVGGVTMQDALRQLEADIETDVIVVVSKPPAPAVMASVMDMLRGGPKPSVVNFLDADPPMLRPGHVGLAHTLDEAAVRAVALAIRADETSLWQRLAGEELQGRDKAETVAPLSATQKYVRGVFSGGTFAVEAAIVLRDRLQTIYTNAGVRGTRPLPDARHSLAHCCVDMGADLFTLGKPHPMLEPGMRRERILAEASDPETAVVLFDLVLGYGVHPDPGGLLAEYVNQARALARRNGREITFVASVCGVEADPQNRSRQVESLRGAGVIVLPSNASAARFAADIVTRAQLN